MARAINVSGADVKDSKGTGFDPIPAGNYNVDIFDHEVKQYGNGTANAGRDFLALHLRISDGQKGANRRLFTNVGDFPRWAPKNGKPEGAVNFLFFQFYKALGVEFDGVEGDVDLPDLEDLNGSRLAVKVAIVNDTYAFNKAMGEWKTEKEKAEERGKTFTTPRPEPEEFKRNEVKEFLPEIDEDDLPDPDSDSDDDEFSL